MSEPGEIYTGTAMEEAQRERFEQLVRDGRPEEAAEALAPIHPAAGAEALQQLPVELRHLPLEALSPEKAADLLEELPSDIAADVVSRMEPETSSTILGLMRSDASVDVLQEIRPDQAQAILELVDLEDAATKRQLLAFEEDTAGGLMQAELVAIPETATAHEVVQLLRTNARQYADYPATYLYVVDQEQHLKGVVSLRSLLLCSAETPITTLTNPDCLSVPATLPGAEVVKLFHQYHYLAIPVVDRAGRLIGLVTEDDAFRFQREEREEELLSLAGIVGGEEFRDMPLVKRSWRRLSWLSINIVLNIVAASVIAVYQDTVQAVIALAVFLPIISDMSGCSGNQAVAVSIRELALERIRPRDFLRVIGKEGLVGVLNGMVLGLLLGSAAWIWQKNVALGLVIGGALWLNTIVAVIVGGLVPLVLRSMKQDPALASGPLLTTLTDMLGFLLVLTLAHRFLYALV